LILAAASVRTAATIRPLGQQTRRHRTYVQEAFPLRSLEIARTRGVTAVLGPTNTGKTHLAIERMLGHDTGLIGLPLRLLAREVYDRIVAKIGPASVALITGEEKIKPENPRFYVCTVEAMPRDVEVDFLAIDEIQLCGDPERGHVFTDRLLHARGRQETLLLGAQTMRDAINDLLPGANHISRPRLSKLAYAGQKKISRLPRRTAIVAFSASDVYAVAELMRRQRGGAAVVLGALSPRTRNAQVALYQSGDVDFLVATDAIGMGLNLDVDHVAFAGTRKFDGQVHRELSAGELGQIAGRAGRHMNDGTFGVTGETEPLATDLIERLESHTFDPVRVLQWRNRELDFGTLERLKDSLKETPNHPRLQRARMSDDTIALEAMSADPEIANLARSQAAVRLLWDVCQVPDYRKISNANHAELVGQLFKYLRTGEEKIPEDWFAAQIAFADRTDGDIDTLATRIAHIRTWTFVSNRAEWFARPEEWQAKTREVEDKLSDALHERLTQRFVDKRTSILMRKLNDKDELIAEVAEDGGIQVEGHYVGKLAGFRFLPDTATTDVQGKAARNAASQIVSKEMGMRARRVASAQVNALKLTRRGTIEWRGEEIARLEKADDPLKPAVHLIIDEYLSGPDKERVQKRLEEWLLGQIDEKLKPLIAIAKAEDITGLARGIAFRLTENFGVLKREAVAEDMKSLDQTGRAQLRKYGVRFGAFNIFFPMLLKPAAADLTLVLWALRNGGENGIDMAAIPDPPRPGLTSISADPARPEAYYRAAGFHLCGPRAVRLDMLERLADLIRPLTAWRPGETTAGQAPKPVPKGASGNGGFLIIPEMMSIMGCGAEELGAVLRSLGFSAEKRRKVVVVKVVAPQAEASMEAQPAGDGAAATPAEPVSAVTDPEAVPLVDAPSPAAAIVIGTVAEVQMNGQAAVPAAPPAETAPEAAPAIVMDAMPALDVAAKSEVEAQPGSQPEPEYEDVWRPRRRAGGERDFRRHDRPRDGDRASSATAPTNADGQPASGDAPRGERRPYRGGGGKPGERGGDRRHGNRPGQDRAVAATGEANPAAPAADATVGQPDRAGRPDRPAFKGGGGGAGRDRRPDRGGGRDGGRDNRRDDRRREGGERQRFSAAPEKKRAEADPNSPFAALSQLKAQLEKRADGETKS
jgi:ATP-dependent RNA helicase SUPV3L1/SUV3